MLRKIFALSAVLASVVAFSSDAEARHCCRQHRNRCGHQRHCCNNYVAPCNSCNTQAAPAAEAAPAPDAAAAPAAK